MWREEMEGQGRHSVFVGSQSTHWSTRQTAPIGISWCTFQVLPLRNWYGDELNPQYRFYFHFSVIFSKSLGTSPNKCLLTDYIYELTLRKCHILGYFHSETWSSVQQGEVGEGRVYERVAVYQTLFWTPCTCQSFFATTLILGHVLLTALCRARKLKIKINLM